MATNRVVCVASVSTMTCRCGHSCEEKEYQLFIRRGPHARPVRLVGEWNHYATREAAEAAIKSLRTRGRL